MKFLKKKKKRLLFFKLKNTGHKLRESVAQKTFHFLVLYTVYTHIHTAVFSTRYLLNIYHNLHINTEDIQTI